MTVVEALDLAKSAGVSISIDGDDLVLRASQAPDPEVLVRLAQQKADILDLHRMHAGRSEDDWKVLFDERAAIMEFDGGLPRTEAEEAARQEVEALRLVVERIANA